MKMEVIFKYDDIGRPDIIVTRDLYRIIRGLESMLESPFNRINVINTNYFKGTYAWLTSNDVTRLVDRLGHDSVQAELKMIGRNNNGDLYVVISPESYEKICEDLGL